MSFPNSLTYTNLLIQALERSNLDEDKKRCEVLQHLYHIKGKAMAAFCHKSRDMEEEVISVEYKLERFLKPGLVEDPSIIKFDKNKLEKTYNVCGHDIKFKVDTGAVTIVIDAEPEYPLEEEQRKQLAGAYKEYVDIYPDDGAMTKDKLPELSTQFHDLDFGKVESFKLTTYRKGKDKEEDIRRGPDAENEVITIQGPFDVVAVSNPKKKDERGEELFPVINVPFIDPASGKAFDYPVSLKSRNMTTRGLLSRTFINEMDYMLVPEKHDTHSIDLSKIDLDAVNKILQPVPA